MKFRSICIESLIPLFFYLMGLYLVIYECIQELVLLKTIKLFAH